ncbi:MAG TPA: ABC transporter permease [Prolixibacteraceae bacterium]|nr:ABC transporter permease [Prolixibacteraceae bacterium]
MKKVFQYISRGLDLMQKHFILELKSIFTDSGAILILFIAVVVYPVIYSIVYMKGTLTDMPIALVDQDHTASSQKYAQMLDASAEMNISVYPSDLKEAETLLKNKKIDGVVFIPEGFQKKLLSGEQGEVSLYADAAYFLKYRNEMMAVSYTNTYFSAGISVKKYMASGQEYRQALVSNSPLDPQSHILYNPGTSYGSFVMPVIMLIVIQQTLLIAIGLMGGSFSESKKSPFILDPKDRKHEIIPHLLGKAGAYFATSLLNIAFTLVMVYHWFGYTDKANFLHVLMLVFPFLVAVIFLGIGISTLFHHRESAITFMVFLSPIALFVTGVSWPTASIPDWLVTVSKLLPGSTLVPAYYRLRNMGVGLAGIKHEMWMLYLQAAIYMGITIVYYYYRMGVANRKLLFKK